MQLLYFKSLVLLKKNPLNLKLTELFGTQMIFVKCVVILCSRKVDYANFFSYIFKQNPSSEVHVYTTKPTKQPRPMSERPLRTLK